MVLLLYSEQKLLIYRGRSHRGRIEVGVRGRSHRGRSIEVGRGRDEVGVIHVYYMYFELEIENLQKSCASILSFFIAKNVKLTN